MNKQRRTSNINNIVRYDTSGNVSLPAGLTVEGLDAGFVKSDANGLFSVDTAAYVTLSSLLTGYVIGTNVPLAATDSILQAFGKIQSQINNIPSVNMYNSNGTLTGIRTINTGGFDLIYTGTDTAVAGYARFIQMTPTLIASANSDNLIGLDVNPTFTPGAFTSVKRWGTRTRSLWINHENWNAATANPALYIGDDTTAAFYVQPGIPSTGISATQLFMRGNNPGLGLWYFTLEADYNVTFTAGPYVENMYFKMGSSNIMTLTQSGTNLVGSLVGNTLRTRNSFSGSYTQNGTVFSNFSQTFDGASAGGNTLYMGQSNIEVTGGSTTVQTQGIDIEQHIKLSGGTSRISASNYILQYRGYSGDISTNSGNVMLGISISTGHNKSDTTTSIVTGGVTGNAANIFNYVGTINNAYGYSSTLNATTSASHKSSTITNYISFRSTAVIGATSGTSTATITNYYGIYLDTPVVRLTGSIGSRWGIYAPDVLMNHHINGSLLIGTATPSTYMLDVSGTARVTGGILINNQSVLTYGASGSILIGEGASVPSLPNSSMIAIGNNAKVSMTINYVGGGVAIGKDAEVSNYGVAIGGDTKINAGVNINSGNLLAKNGVFLNASMGSVPTTASVIINGTATNTGGANAGASVTIAGSNFGDGSVAIAAMVPSGEKGVFVVGQPNDNNNFGDDVTAISNVYFGSGISRTKADGTTQRTGYGWPYAINGSGARGTDFAGGNITIAGGKGTGTGTSGDVIFSTATPTSTGTTLQTLTNRVWIKGQNGNVGIGASPNASYKLDVQGIVAAVNAMYINSASDALFYFQKNGANKWRIGNADVSNLNYFQLYDSVSNLERIRWNNNSTATFTSDFTFVGNTNAPVTVQSTQPTFLVEAIGATNSVNIDLKPSGGANATIRNISGSSIEFHTGSTATERVRIAINGNVGINNNDPAQKLSVSGNAQINHAYSHAAGVYTSGLFSYTNVSTAVGPSYTAGMFYGAFQSYYRNEFEGGATIPNSVLQGSQFNGTNVRFVNANTAITMTQGSGGAVRAYTNQILQFSFDNAQTSCSVSHVAGIQILAPYYQGANNPTISNYYGLLLNDSAEYTASLTITKRWAIYQNGASDNSYFKGKVIIGNTDAVGSSPLNVKNLPTSSAGLSTGDIWNDAGTLKIV